MVAFVYAPLVRQNWTSLEISLEAINDGSRWCTFLLVLSQALFFHLAVDQDKCHLDVFVCSFPVSITYIRARKIPEQGVQLTGQKDARPPCHRVTRRVDAKFQPPREVLRSCHGHHCAEMRRLPTQASCISRPRDPDQQTGLDLRPRESDPNATPKPRPEYIGRARS